MTSLLLSSPGPVQRPSLNQTLTQRVTSRGGTIKSLSSDVVNKETGWRPGWAGSSPRLPLSLVAQLHCMGINYPLVTSLTFDVDKYRAPFGLVLVVPLRLQ